MDTDTPTWPSYTFKAMGSHITIDIDADPQTARAGFRAAEEFFRRIEALLTRFKPTSELSYLNAHPGQWVEISPIFWQVLDAALGLARQTGGLFDPTVLPALEAAGYTRDFELIRREGAVSPAPSPEASPAGLRGRWAEIEMDPARRAVRLPEGVKIDLGGLAKGWTAQQTALLVGQWGPCLVDAGGDLVAGAPPAGMPGWPVSVAAPWEDANGEQPDLVVMWLARASLTTSGTDWRRWDQGGRTVHHLIDPRSGEPAATDVLSVSVLAVEAAPAEAWATAGIVLGMDAARQDFAGRGVAAVLVGQDRRVEVTPAMQPYIVWSALPELA